MCILAPESATNSLSSGFITDGAGRHHSLVGEKKVALSVAVSFKIFLANLHASPRARRSWPPEIYPQISKRTDCAAEELCFDFCPSDGPLFSRMSAWRNVAFVNRTRRIGPKVFVPFRKIEKDSSGSVSWNIQPNCRTSFNLATTFYHHPYSVFFGCSSTFLCGNEHLLPSLQPDSDLSKWHSGGCQLSQGN